MPAAALHRVIVSSSDLADTLPLYEGVLGLLLERRADGFAWLRSADGVEIMLHERPAAASDTAVAVTFAVSRLDDVVARWVAAGGSLIDAPERRPWGERMAVVRDADGHVVCLSETP
ncbi:VOC family protein [Leifsonia sp. NPDC080035]|uniref:VOC family protein n=1 Tax=Leifsonia sp. NPDC080035 TaxID=3143936 RepID=A0AAU7GHP4_9MICO